MYKLTTFFLIFISYSISFKTASGQNPEKPMAIIAYYMGDGQDIRAYKTNQLTHIIYSFLHLDGNKLVVSNSNDSLAITRLVNLKKDNPGLKIILSLGGWGGCPSCSDVFNSQSGREEFAQSALKLFQTYHADGLDLDWEYPAIASVPGFKFIPEDRQNFTSLIKTLRNTVGNGYEISFAAGGFSEFLTQSVEWDKVMPLVNYVNMMTYDLVNGYSKRTGHLTSLYSTKEQNESVDFNVKFLDSIGVPMNKVVIGLTFYARLFTTDKPENDGLYKPGKFSGYMIYKEFNEKMGAGTGYERYWDDIAKASYSYNKTTRTFSTFDDDRSVYLKTRYALSKKLGGVMFWELRGDKESGGLLETIYNASREK